MITQSQHKIPFRVVMIGEASVGKTSLISQLTDSRFDLNVASTISANFRTYCQEIDNQVVELQILDTAGQERYRALSPLYYRKAAAGIAVFSFDNPGSMETLPEVVNLFLEVAASAVVFVAGNKSDILEHKTSEIPCTTAKDFAREHGWPLYLTSAKTGEGVCELFNAVCDRLARTIIDGQLPLSFALPDANDGCC
jgi:small GTP-binding protein